MKVAILERREHIAGNAYDYEDEAGIPVHKYGPHIYHTTNERVNQFLSRFTEWTDYQHKVLANIHGTLMPVPFNHKSLKLAFGDDKGERLYQKLVATFGENKKVPIMELREKNDPELVEVADYVFENVFLHYTMKQWGQTPDQIDPSITGRVPVFVGDDDRYFPGAPFQGMPVESSCRRGPWIAGSEMPTRVGMKEDMQMLRSRDFFLCTRYMPMAPPPWAMMETDQMAWM